MRGVIKFYSLKKRFGFITSLDGEDYYFNAAGLRRDRDYDPCEGDEVEFETRDARQGKIAHTIVQDV